MPEPAGAPQSFSPNHPPAQPPSSRTQTRPRRSTPPSTEEKDEPPPELIESDDEEPEPFAKRRRRQKDLTEEEIADLFAPTDDEAEEAKIDHALISSGVDRSMAVKKAKDIAAPDAATFVELYGKRCHSERGKWHSMGPECPRTRSL